MLRTLATVATGADHVAVARAAPLDSFPPGSDARAVVEALTAARLLVASSAGTTPTVRFAHEALISRWQRARDQLTNDRRDLETRELVERQRTRWQQASGRSQRQLLLRDPDLANAVDLDQRWAGELDADTRQFIQASRRRARRQQQMIVIVAAVFGLVALAAIYAQRQAISARQQAETQTRLANQNLAEALVEKGLPLFVQRYFHNSYILGAKALVLDPRSARAHALAYLSAMSVPYVHKNILVGNEEVVSSVAFSPDGRTLAAAARYGTIWLWGLPVGQPLATLTGHGMWVRSMALSPDGQTLASAAGDQTVRLWGLPAGQPLATLTGHEAQVTSVALSPDGQTLASAASDGSIRLWSLPVGQPLAALTGPKGEVTSVAFSPDGQTLASVAHDRTIWLWSLPAGQPLATLTGPTDLVWSMTFSPDGRTLASAAEDEDIWLWSLPSGQPLATLTGHKKGVTSVALSPDGQTLASASKDGTVRLWPQMAFFSLSPEALYRQAQLDTSMRVEGMAARNLTFKLWQALKKQTAD